MQELKYTGIAILITVTIFSCTEKSTIKENEINIKSKEHLQLTNKYIFSHTGIGGITDHTHKSDLKKYTEIRRCKKK